MPDKLDPINISKPLLHRQTAGVHHSLKELSHLMPIPLCRLTASGEKQPVCKNDDKQ